MDDFTAAHLADWLAAHVADSDMQRVSDLMLDFLHEYPELPSEGRSWSEIRSLAERWAE